MDSIPPLVERAVEVLGASIAPPRPSVHHIPDTPTSAGSEKFFAGDGQPEVADANESNRQDVQEEAPQDVRTPI